MDNTTFSTYPTLATSYSHADGNGNVSMRTNGNQIPVARYLYGPFRNTFAASGPLAEANTHRFSSKEIYQGIVPRSVSHHSGLFVTYLSGSYLRCRQ